MAGELASGPNQRRRFIEYFALSGLSSTLLPRFDPVLKCVDKELLANCGTRIDPSSYSMHSAEIARLRASGLSKRAAKSFLLSGSFPLPGMRKNATGSSEADLALSSPRCHREPRRLLMAARM